MGAQGVQQKWPSRTPVWTWTAILLTFVFFAGMLTLEYERSWTAAERLYLSDYIKSGARGKASATAASKYTLLEAVVGPGQGKGQRLVTPFRRFRGGVLLAQDELALRRPDQARSILTGLTVQDPLASNVHFMLGSMDEVEGRLADARNEYLLEYQITGSPLSGERALKLSRGRSIDLPARCPAVLAIRLRHLSMATPNRLGEAYLTRQVRSFGMIYSVNPPTSMLFPCR